MILSSLSVPFYEVPDPDASFHRFCQNVTDIIAPNIKYKIVNV